MIRSESEQAALKLTRLLLALGHRWIAMLAGPEGVSITQERMAGYQRIFQEFGLPVSHELSFRDTYTMSGGQCRVQPALAVAERPTAFFAANKFIAMGLFSGCMSKDGAKKLYYPRW